LGNFAASLEAFREAKVRFPNSDYAWDGIADVLKEMGEHELSLLAYREAEERFPDNPVPFNGYVSALRAQGRRDEAVKYALTVANRFPDNALLGRASVRLYETEAGITKPPASIKNPCDSMEECPRNPGLCRRPLSNRCRHSGSLGYLEDRLRIMPDNGDY